MTCGMWPPETTGGVPETFSSEARVWRVNRPTCNILYE